MPAALTAWLLLSGAVHGAELDQDRGNGEDPGANQVSLGSGAVMHLGGYLDVGWFDAQGDGVAYASAPSFGQYGTAWTFLGDPWANPVNSLGDPADLGLEYRSSLDRLDSIDSDGNPSFVVNQWHQSVAVAASPQLAVRAALDLAPRAGTLGSLGDLVWVDYAYVEWLPSRTADWRISAGKVESSFGWEYRDRQAVDRFGITPSLLARYTTGTPVGLRLRGSLLDRHLWVNAALTNDGAATERFGHLAHDIDDDGTPTATTRIGVHRTDGTLALDLGGSAQLGYRGEDTLASMFGGDLTVRWWKLTLKAELLRARYPRFRADQDVLDADAWFVELSALPLPWLRPLTRVDRRVATLATGPNLYLSDVVRTTVGARVNVDTYAFLKAEYLHLDEQGPLEIANDVFTTSVIVEY